MLALDLETFPITPHEPLPRPVCVSWANHNGKGLELYRDSFLSRVQDHIVGCNTAFDMGVIYQHSPQYRERIWDDYANGRMHCVEVAARLIDTGSRGYQDKVYNLGTIAKAYTNHVLDKNDPWRLRYGELANVPVEQWPVEAQNYARLDGIATYDVWVAQQQYEDLLVDEPRQAAKAWWLSLTSAWGIKTDKARVDAFAESIGKEAQALEKDLIAAGLLTPGRMTRTGRYQKPKRNTKPAEARMLEACGANTKYTDGAKPKVSLKNDHCIESGDPILKKYGEYGKLLSFLNKDIKELRAEEFYTIRTRWTTPLETGRTSTSPNVQNFGRDGKARSCIVPRKGNLILGADFSGNELATWAQCCIWIVGWSDLANALNDGIDAHADLAISLAPEFGDWRQLKAAIKAGDKDAERARQFSKIGNFGFQGGMGETSFIDYAKGYGLVVTPDQARMIKTAWRNKWRENKKYFEFIHATNGTVQHFKSGRIRVRASFCAAANSYFQGLAADLTGHAGFNISRACHVEMPCLFCKGSGCPSCGGSGRDALFGCRPINYVHDEYLLEVQEDLGHYAALSLIEHMRQAGRLWLPDVKLDAEPCLMHYWDKSAKPVYNERGELIPWTKNAA